VLFGNFTSALSEGSSPLSFIVVFIGMVSVVVIVKKKGEVKQVKQVRRKTEGSYSYHSACTQRHTKYLRRLPLANTDTIYALATNIIVFSYSLLIQ
jgi:hypothetical protein